MARARPGDDEPTISTLTSDLMTASIRAHMALKFKISDATRLEIARELQHAIEALDFQIDDERQADSE